MAIKDGQPYMDLNIITQQFDSFVKNQERLEKHLVESNKENLERWSKIEKALLDIAVHDEKFNAIRTSQKASWKHIDSLQVSVDVLKDHQARCPDKKVDKLEEKIDAVCEFQGKCPAKSARAHIIGMWAILGAATAFMIALYNQTMHLSESLNEVFKNIGKP